MMCKFIESFIRLVEQMFGTYRHHGDGVRANGEPCGDNQEVWFVYLL